MHNVYNTETLTVHVNIDTLGAVQILCNAPEGGGWPGRYVGVKNGGNKNDPKMRYIIFEWPPKRHIIFLLAKDDSET